MDKLKLNSSVIGHTSNPFHVDFHALKGFFDLSQGQTESVDYFYNVLILPSSLANWWA